MTPKIKSGKMLPKGYTFFILSQPPPPGDIIFKIDERGKKGEKGEKRGGQ